VFRHRNDFPVGQGQDLVRSSDPPEGCFFDPVGCRDLLEARPPPQRRLCAPPSAVTWAGHPQMSRPFFCWVPVDSQENAASRWTAIQLDTLGPPGRSQIGVNHHNLTQPNKGPDRTLDPPFEGSSPSAPGSFFDLRMGHPGAGSRGFRCHLLQPSNPSGGAQGGVDGPGGIAKQLGVAWL
jgi:hypothetical protein